MSVFALSQGFSSIGHCGISTAPDSQLRSKGFPTPIFPSRLLLQPPLLDLLPPMTPMQSNSQEFKSLVDIGCGVFCQAHVPDASRIFISIGLGFHVECTLEEAPKVIKLRQDALQKKVSHTVKQAAEVKAHIKFMVEAIRQLSGL